MINYRPTNNNIQNNFPDYEPPKIKGYKKQFSIEIPQGETTQETPVTKPVEGEEIIEIQTPSREEIIETGTIETKPSSKSKRYTDSEKSQFISDMVSAYTKGLASKGINTEYAKYLAVQDALESAYGKSYSGNWNFGNIITGASKASYTEGKDHDAKGNSITQKFRNFDSLDDYINYKISLLSGNRYKAFDGDIDKFYDRVKAGGYATSPNYVKNLTNLFNQTRFVKHGGILKRI